MLRLGAYVCGRGAWAEVGLQCHVLCVAAAAAAALATQALTDVSWRQQ